MANLAYWRFSTLDGFWLNLPGQYSEKVRKIIVPDKAGAGRGPAGNSKKMTILGLYGSAPCVEFIPVFFEIDQSHADSVTVICTEDLLSSAISEFLLAPPI